MRHPTFQHEGTENGRVGSIPRLIALLPIAPMETRSHGVGRASDPVRRAKNERSLSASRPSHSAQGPRSSGRAGKKVQLSTETRRPNTKRHGEEEEEKEEEGGRRRHRGKQSEGCRSLPSGPARKEGNGRLHEAPSLLAFLSILIKASPIPSDGSTGQIEFDLPRRPASKTKPPRTHLVLRCRELLDPLGELRLHAPVVLSVAVVVLRGAVDVLAERAVVDKLVEEPVDHERGERRLEHAVVTGHSGQVARS